jgi:hypothetical protein
MGLARDQGPVGLWHLVDLVKARARGSTQPFFGAHFYWRVGCLGADIALPSNLWGHQFIKFISAAIVGTEQKARIPWFLCMRALSVGLKIGPCFRCVCVSDQIFSQPKKFPFPPEMTLWPRVARFFLAQYTKTKKNVPHFHNITKWP